MIESVNDIGEDRLDHEMRDLARRLNLEDIQDALRFPKYFQIETVRLCNSRCPFCAVDRWDKSVPFMPDRLFRKIVEELGDHRDWVELINIQRAGEPLMDREIAQKIEQLKNAGMKRVCLSTNASLLTGDKSRQLMDSGLDEIMFSIDSIDRNTYESLRRGLDYDKVTENIRTFFSLREALRPEMAVRVRGVSFYDTKKPEDVSELERWEAFWAEFRKPQDRIYMKRAHNWGNQKTWDDRMTGHPWVYHPCIVPWSTLHVTTMGKVPLCPQDYDAVMDLGDIHESSIGEVWRNSRWDRVRALHQSGRRNEITLCQGCRLFDEELSLEKKTDPEHA